MTAEKRIAYNEKVKLHNSFSVSLIINDPSSDNNLTFITGTCGLLKQS